MDCIKLLLDNKPVFDSTNGVVRLVREDPPAHCVFKVESFSKSKENYIDSSEFQAGDYTWVLSVYPQGCKQKGAEGHLSLYVSMVDKLSSCSFVYAMFRFFIYDQIREKFVIFLDVRDKLIHADLDYRAGIPKLLPLDVFSNASNGFLVDDCCVFGVEVFVVRADGMKMKPECPGTMSYSYTWRIENFSQLDNSTHSPEFRLGEWSWNLSIQIGNDKKATENCLSLYLWLKNSINLPQSSTLYTRFRLRLKNQGARENHQKTVSRNFPRGNATSWGFRSFILMNDLHNKGFILNDAIIIEVDIDEMLVK